MAKALLFTDMHIHSHKDSVSRLQDCLNVLNWIFEQAKQHQCEHILFLGDLLHERNRIDVLNYLRMFEVFTRHMIEQRPPFDVWLLIGNHDTYHKQRWDVNSVKPLGVIPGVNIIDEPKTLKIGGRYIDFLPYTEEPIAELNKLKKNEGDRSLLLAHLAVNGATLNKMYGTKADVIVEYDTEMCVVGPGVFKDWQQTFLGHYHGAQLLEHNVEYIGSPLQLSFGEAFEEKHIVILDLDDLSKEYVVNDFSPKHYILSPEDVSSYNLKNNFVRILLDDVSSKEVVDLRREMIQNQNVSYIDFKQKDKKQDDDLQIVQDTREMLRSESDMIDMYLKAMGVPDGLDEKKLRQVGRDACQMPS